MSECYCHKHQTANHADGSEYCKVWDVAERATAERIRKNLQALGFRHEPTTGDWIRRNEVLAYLEGEAGA